MPIQLMHIVSLSKFDASVGDSSTKETHRGGSKDLPEACLMSTTKPVQAGSKALEIETQGIASDWKEYGRQTHATDCQVVQPHKPHQMHSSFEEKSWSHQGCKCRNHRRSHAVPWWSSLQVNQCFVPATRPSNGQLDHPGKVSIPIETQEGIPVVPARSWAIGRTYLP